MDWDHLRLPDSRELARDSEQIEACWWTETRGCCGASAFAGRVGAMADPSEGLSHHMSDAFSVVEMSLEDPSKKSPFLAALTGHGTARTTNHVATELAHKVVDDFWDNESA